MLIKTIPVGQLETNCYIVTDENTLECAVIDPGDESNTILDYLEMNHLKCRAVLLTHGHYDHVGAVDTIAEETGAVVLMKDARTVIANPDGRAFINCSGNSGMATPMSSRGSSNRRRYSSPAVTMIAPNMLPVMEPMPPSTMISRKLYVMVNRKFLGSTVPSRAP